MIWTLFSIWPLPNKFNICTVLQFPDVQQWRCYYWSLDARNECQTWEQSRTLCYRLYAHIYCCVGYSQVFRLVFLFAHKCYSILFRACVIKYPRKIWKTSNGPSTRIVLLFYGEKLPWSLIFVWYLSVQLWMEKFKEKSLANKCR